MAGYIQASDTLLRRNLAVAGTHRPRLTQSQRQRDQLPRSEYFHVRMCQIPHADAHANESCAPTALCTTGPLTVEAACSLLTFPDEPGMITEDQSSVVAFLSSSEAHGGAGPVERIDTHASIVFLEGERAWKLKRAVRYAYLDYSTADRRRAMCEAEVRINRRTAAALYRGVNAVTRHAGDRLTIGGGGTPVDWLVEMTRFD